MLSDYDYLLPEDRIAQVPLEDRSASKLLHVPLAGGPFADLGFRDVPSLLRQGDLLVLNDTRVTALRLFGTRPSGGKVEALLLREIDGLDGLVFEALLKPSKRLPPGTHIEFDDGLAGEVLEGGSELLRLVRFDFADRERILNSGQTPLPPYITASLQDPARYQTVYADRGGSAAAPTAGLHFTPELLGALEEQGVEIARVTLDVSIDTFRPVQSESLDAHAMHGETCRISEAAARQIASARGRIIAVGTTAVRTLESMAVSSRQVGSGEMTTKLFIRPGYRFQVVDGMFTNFHMPRTSMMMMLSAMCGRERLLDSYRHALANGYRFLSFGDSMLLL